MRFSGPLGGRHQAGIAPWWQRQPALLQRQRGSGCGELPRQRLRGGHSQRQHGCGGARGQLRGTRAEVFPLSFFSSDCVRVVQDGSGLQLPSAYEPEPLGKYGTLDVAFEYDSSQQYLAVTVTAATDIPALKQTGNIAWQVHLVLLPTKKQRAKTGVQKGPCPVFTETFKFSRVEQEALGDYAVRFRLYSIRRMKKEKVLGEKVFYLTKLNLQGKIALPVTLEPGSELAVSVSMSR